jgi:hypothetical protein
MIYKKLKSYFVFKLCVKKTKTMSTDQEIVNPQFSEAFVPEISGKNMVRCNKSSDVYKFIKTGKRYVIELPATKTILNVECTFAAIRAADMKIKSVFVNGKKSDDDEEYTFSYQYEQFDSIYYTSFAYREKCIVYISVDDLF